MTLSLHVPSSVNHALRAGREHWGPALLDWQNARVGIWGVECDRDTALHEGDRVEVYRPLLNDPRAARRARVARQRIESNLRRRAR